MDDILKEILINRVFLILMFVGGGIMFGFIGIMAWWSVAMVRTEFQEWRSLTLLLAQTIRNLDAKLSIAPPASSHPKESETENDMH